MTDAPSSWTVTTHDWALEVDEEHLRSIRDCGEELRRGGLRHLVLETLAYADDEAQSLGRTGAATVTYLRDGSVSVIDDGRGTDTRRDPHGRVIRKPVMATKDVRFFDRADPPLLPDGLPRRGMSTVSALSAWLVHENRRGDEAWTQTYRLGVPDTALVPLDAPARSGTTVTFLPLDDVREPRHLTEQDLVAFPWLSITVTS